MGSTKKILLFIAYIFKYTHMPHFIKYALFFLMKGENIRTTFRIKPNKALMDLNLGEFIQFWIFMEGSYELAWISYLRNNPKGKIFIDIGANVGIYTLSLFDVYDRIFAFEPEEKNYNQLQKNIKINKIQNVQAYKKAVSSVNKSVNLFLSMYNEGLHSLVLKNSGKTQRVNAITMDTFLKYKNIKDIGLVKIDVEGAELEVLKGASKVIEKVHPDILVEFNKPRLEKAGYKVTKVYDYLIKKGYKAFALTNRSLKKFKKSNLSTIYIENLMFLYR